jgi:hypothetical protein
MDNLGSFAEQFNGNYRQQGKPVRPEVVGGVPAEGKNDTKGNSRATGASVLAHLNISPFPNSRSCRAGVLIIGV